MSTPRSFLKNAYQQKTRLMYSNGFLIYMI